MSLTISIRMTAQEVADLRDMAHNSETGAEGVCDFVRLLIHRERNRRKGLPKPLPSDWQGVYRVGGPKKKISSRLPEAGGVAHGTVTERRDTTTPRAVGDEISSKRPRLEGADNTVE